MDQREHVRALAGLRPEGSALYSLIRAKNRPFWKDLLDVFVSGGAVASAADVIDSVKTHNYLIAGPAAGTIVALQDGSVVSSVSVPGWRPEWQDDFKKVTFDGYSYRKVARVDA